MGQEEELGQKGRGIGGLGGYWAANRQHGTGEEGSSPPCTNGLHPKYGLCHC